MPNNKRSSKRSKKRVRFGGAVYKDYHDPSNIDLVGCKDNQCTLKMGGVDIKGNLDENLLAELRSNDPKASTYLSDELKEKLGLNIQYIYELASCTIKKYVVKSADKPIRSYSAGTQNEVEIYSNTQNQNYEVVLKNANGQRVQISTINKVPDLASDSKLDNKTKVELDLDLHKIVELKKKCNEKMENEKRLAAEARVAKEEEKKRVAEAAKKDAEELERRKVEAADIERRRIEEADRAAVAAADAKRIADEAEEKAAEVARKLKEQQEAEKRRKEEAAAAKATEVAEKARLARLAKEDRERLVREEKEREKEAERERKQAAVAATELERQRVAALHEKEEAQKEADRLKRVADEKDKEEKAATLAADRAAENERRAQEKRVAEEAARQKQEAADAVVKEAQAEAAKAATLVAKAAEASRAEAARREKDAAATQVKKCASWVAKNGSNACEELGCTYHSKTRECLPLGVKPKQFGPAQSHPLAQQPIDRCSKLTPWQCLVHVMSRINKSFESLFNFADKNKDNSVSRAEFKSAMNTHIKELDDAKINVVFNLLDLDNDNKLSYNELKSLDKLSYDLLMKMSPKEMQQKFSTVKSALASQQSTPAYMSETARVLGNMPKTQYTTGSRGGGKKTRKNKRSKIRSKKRKTKNN